MSNTMFQESKDLASKNSGRKLTSTFFHSSFIYRNTRDSESYHERLQRLYLCSCNDMAVIEWNMGAWRRWHIENRIESRIEFKIILLTFKALINMAPLSHQRNSYLINTCCWLDFFPGVLLPYRPQIQGRSSGHIVDYDLWIAYQRS